MGLKKCKYKYDDIVIDLEKKKRHKVINTHNNFSDITYFVEDVVSKRRRWFDEDQLVGIVEYRLSKLL